MSKRWLVVGVALAVVAAIWLWRGRSAVDVASIDLIEVFDAAEKRTNLPSLESAFGVEEVSIEGTTKRSLRAHPTSRIIWRLEVPDNAWLRTSVALAPGAWELEGDGVLFRIGVSDARAYEELLNLLVDPFGTPEDRRWIPVVVDLSGYGGMNVEVIFNTNVGAPGSEDSRNDWAVWGEPEIYVE